MIEDLERKCKKKAALNSVASFFEQQVITQLLPQQPQQPQLPLLRCR